MVSGALGSFGQGLGFRVLGLGLRVWGYGQGKPLSRLIGLRVFTAVNPKPSTGQPHHLGNLQRYG